MEKKDKRKRGAPKGSKNAAGNIGGTGAPVKYKKEYDKQAFKICLLGATDQELADFYEIAVSTLSEWKVKYLSFSEAIKKGKMLADANVVERLYIRALGYSHPDVDIKVIRDKIVKTELIKHYPPDTTAAIFWLKNRQKNKWRDKHEVMLDFDSMTEEQLNQVIEKLVEKSKNLEGRG